MKQSPDPARQNQRMMQISMRSFASVFMMLLAIMLLTYIMTLLIPSGCYLRAEVDGRTVILPGTYALSNGGISFSDWLMSPFHALHSGNSATLLAFLVFFLVIGGAFSALDACGLLRYMLRLVYATFQNQRYKLLSLVTLFFMALGALVGSFEECVPLVPIAAALAYSMGWDALVGLGMSILAVGCGFSSGVLNPFTVGVAQNLAGLPMFSGVSLRLVTFVLVYALLLMLLIPYAKRIESDPQRSLVYDRNASRRWMALSVCFERDERMDRALIAFAAVIGLCLLTILLSAFLPALQSILMLLIAAALLVAGIVAPLLAGMPGTKLFQTFFSGLGSMLPVVVLVLMASSIQYTLESAHILDTILYRIASLTEQSPSWAVVLLVFLLVLVMDLFVSSGSIKAFLLMPLIVPIADLTGISRQLSVLAFTFGDGFSNMVYPTNSVLLISLGVAGVSYGKWIKWCWKFQLAILALNVLLLLFGSVVGY